jgi:DNA-directed RNA polymerase I and III subunit RPAC2
MTAIEALHKGLDDLADLCSHIEDKFTEKINQGGYPTEEV